MELKFQEAQLQHWLTSIIGHKYRVSCLVWDTEFYVFFCRKFSSLTIDDHRILFVGVEPILSLSAMLSSKVSEGVQFINLCLDTFVSCLNRDFDLWLRLIFKCQFLRSHWQCSNICTYILWLMDYSKIICMRVNLYHSQVVVILCNDNIELLKIDNKDCSQIFTEALWHFCDKRCKKSGFSPWAKNMNSEYILKSHSVDFCKLDYT